LTLSELRKSISKLPRDLDDITVVILSQDDFGQISFEQLAFTGIVQSPTFCMTLGTEEGYLLLKKENKLIFKKDL
jgi:hypothetical protein